MRTPPLRRTPTNRDAFGSAEEITMQEALVMTLRVGSESQMAGPANGFGGAANTAPRSATTSEDTSSLNCNWSTNPRWRGGPC